MDQFYHAVLLDRDKCMGCTTCLKRCPTEAIRIRQGKAKINKEFCISCGECIRVCPHHAKISDHDRIDVIKDYEYTVALPAPSLYMQFNGLEDQSLVLKALLELGFNDVYEVSAGAELVSEMSRDYIAEHKDQIEGPFINTACPSVVRLIRIRFPDLLPNILPLKPPVEVAAEMALEQAVKKTGLPREKIGIIFITPCPSKVAYARAPLGVEKSEIDNCIAIKDVYPLLLHHMKKLAGSEDADKLMSGKIGISWGARGGEATGLLTYHNYLAADGIENVIGVLEDLEDRKFRDLDFVELNACNGGCVGGVLTVENAYIAETRLKRLRKYLPVSKQRIEEGQKEMIPLERDIEFQPVYNLGTDIKESFIRLNQLERIEKSLPGLDCGTCGAPTCRALARDIVLGEASENHCIYYLKEKLRKVSDDIDGLDLSINCSQEGSLQKVRDFLGKIKEDIASLDDGKDEYEG